MGYLFLLGVVLLQLFYCLESVDLSEEMGVFVMNYNSTAAASYIATKDGLCANGSAGYAQTEKSGLKFDINGRIHMGSNTKSMTSSLIGILLENNLIRGQKQDGWSTTLAEVFPDTALDTPYENVSLAALASHFSGLAANTDYWSFYSDSVTVMQQREMITRAAFTSTPEVKPDTEFLYSNWGLVVLGHVAEVSMNDEWENLMLQYLINPLQMLGSVDDRSYWPFGAPNSSTANWGHIYMSDTLSHLPCDPNNPPNFLTQATPDFQCDNPPNMGPAGTYSGSLLDTSKYYSWAIACVQGDDTQGIIPLSQKGCEQLQTPYGPMDPTKPDGNLYGHGWGVSYVSNDSNSDEKVKLLWHAGSNTYNYVEVYVIPTKNVIYWAGTNSGAPSDETMIHAILANLPGWKEELCD